jgi:serine protease Do
MHSPGASSLQGVGKLVKLVSCALAASRPESKKAARQEARRTGRHAERLLSLGDTMRLLRTLGMAAFVWAALGFFVSLGWAGPANSRRTAVVEVVERVRGAVVNIHSERNVRAATAEELFAHAPPQNRVNGMGTGIIIDPRGYILTNQHVVDNVSVLRVHLSDGSSHNAHVLVRDRESDLALLKIEVGRPLPTMPLGTSSDVMVGETVIAIGNAYGYEHSVTVGVVSAIKRDVTLNKEISYKALIQTDASINPGNSGGPLLNINGELIGVNVAIRAGAQGIGFAIPVDSALRVAAAMLSVSRRNGTWHGLVCRDVVQAADSADSASRTSSSKSQGSEPPPLLRRLVVERAEPSSPAARAGVQVGDTILQVGNFRVACALDLERALLDRAVGDKVAVLVRRKGEEQRLELVLQSVEQPGLQASDLIWRKLGLRLSVVQAELVVRSNAQLHGGLAVVDIDPEGAAAKAGMQRGDILVGLEQWETVNLDNVVYVLNHPDMSAPSSLRFFILRSGQVHRGWIQRVD